MSVAFPRVGPRAPLLALVVLAVGHLAMITTRTYRPGGDWAFIERRTSDVWSTQFPLTGAWSRYGWNHPGPFLYDALAVPWLLTGGSWRGLWIGALALNLGAISVAWWLTARHSTVAAAALVTAACWTIAAGTPHLVSDPWNASVIVVPLVAVVAAAVAVRADDRRGVAVALVAFVAMAQTHVASGVLLLPVVALTSVVGVRRWRRFTLRWLGVGVAMCLPVLVDTLVNWPGNLWRAFRFTLTADEPAVGLAQTARVIGRASSLTFFSSPRMPSFAAVVGDTPWGLAPFAGLVAGGVAWWMARRRGWSWWQHVLEATALVWLGGALMTWRTRGPLLVWLTTWTVAAAALTWCAVGGVAAQWLAARRERTLTPVRGPLIGVVAVGFAVTNVVGSVGVGYPFQEFTPVVERFANDARPLADEPVLVDLAGPAYEAGAVQSALIAELEGLGARALGRPDQALQLGEHRVADSLGGRRLLVQVEPRTAPPPDAIVVSIWDPLEPAERAEADSLVDGLTELLVGAGLADRTPLLANEQAPLAAFDAPPEISARRGDFERLGILHAAGPRVVLYLIDD
ncbi:MAG: hypothetical protein KDB40_17305 [Acidimicrobiales bacterium]|nr:hypothetical protein [Acidimicrobiales bacterium]MCB9394518.1 hypothetical protein [Acidimicrobiaceae bacterium]